MSNEQKKLSPVEKIKTGSSGLRGSIVESLTDNHTGAIRESDQQLIKFHGMYMQDDRDRREERSEKKLEWLYSFMIRLRLPGGFLSAAQWKGLHEVAGEHSTGTIKITTRQTVQLHGILKTHIKPTLQSFNTYALDSIATCGDVNRNITCTSNPNESPVHQEVFAFANQISTMCLPKTRAFYEIWLGEEKLGDSGLPEEDPLYQNRYLPRKLKIGIAIPPNNDVDVFINDIALIAIIEQGKLTGFNIAAGGGLGATHGNEATYPRLASVLGYVEKENVQKAVYEVITVQRDFGNRSDRKLSRLKYTIDKLGVHGYKEEVEKRTGFLFQPAQPFRFEKRIDNYGWKEDAFGKWHYTLFVENGRVLDEKGLQLKSGLLAIAATDKATFRFTSNQNVIISDVDKQNQPLINALLQEYKLDEHTQKASALRKNAIACVAMNTCPLALAEGQRYLPSLVSKLEPILKKHGLQEDNIILRMTGCPNGCGRSPAAEIGFVGTAYGRYNLHIGGDRLGQRLNTKYKSNIDEEEILYTLDELLEVYAKEKAEEESFGDFSYRKWIQS